MLLTSGNPKPIKSIKHRPRLSKRKSSRFLLGKTGKTEEDLKRDWIRFEVDLLSFSFMRYPK